MQATMTVVYRKWRRVRDADNIDAYVHRMLVREYLAEKRLGWSRVRLLADPPERAASASPAGVEERDTLRAALDRLPQSQRTVLVLRFACDMSIEDVAVALRTSPGNVKSHTSRGLAALRNLLEPTPPPRRGGTMLPDEERAGEALRTLMRDADLPPSYSNVELAVRAGRRRARAYGVVVAGVAASLVTGAASLAAVVLTREDPVEPVADDRPVTCQLAEALALPKGFTAGNVYFGERSGRYLVGAAQPSRDKPFRPVLWKDRAPTQLQTPPETRTLWRSTLTAPSSASCYRPVEWRSLGCPATASGTI